MYQIKYWNISDSEDQRGFTPNERKKRNVENENEYKYKYFYGRGFSSGAPLVNVTADQMYLATVTAFTSGGDGPESEMVEFTSTIRGTSQIKFESYVTIP